MSPDFPSGTVTFLFTDIEGSTGLWEQHPEAMKPALARHDEIVRRAVETNHGYVVKMRGDGCHAAFASGIDAVVASLTAQRALSNETWAELAPQTLRARMGLHTGESQQRAGDYYGSAVNRAARLMSVGNGGQILLSTTTANLVRDQLPAATTLLDLGEYRLKDLIYPERIFQVVHPDLPHDFPPIRSFESFPNNLPVQLTSFVGRERELAEVSHLLSTARLLTFIGPGGTGKSRLAVQLAADELHAFADGAWLVELAPLADSALLLQTIAATFDLRGIPGISLSAIVTAYLRDKRMLLILDNCEHLVEACAQTADQLLHACSHLTILVSSREALGIGGEVVYRVPSLSLPDAEQVTPDALARFEAVQLFVERASAVKTQFALNQRNAPAIVQICQRLDGIPLALELAAARIAVFTPEQIAARLGDRFRLLTGGSRTALPRQHTLRALIDWSYGLLTEQERALFRRLSVFVGGWTFEAAEAIAPDLDVLNLLTQLVNKSLVAVEDQSGETRYHFLETIRQYARDRLFEAGEAEMARDRHLDYFLRQTEQIPTFIDAIAPDLLAQLDLMWLELDNVRAAFAWGLQHRPEDALSIAITWSGQAEELGAPRWIDDAMARVDALPAAVGEAAVPRTTLRIRGEIAVGSIAIRDGESARARLVLEDAVANARRIGDPTLLSVALGILGLALRFVSDIPAMHAVAEENVALARRLNQKSILGMGLILLAWAERREGNVSAQRSHLAEASTLMPSINPLMAYNMYYTLSQEARAVGELDAARSYLQKCITIVPWFKDRSSEAMISSELAHVGRQSGKWDTAQSLYRETILQWKDLGQRAAVANQLECFGIIACAQGQPGRAVRLFGAAEALREAIGAPMLDYERIEYDREVTALHKQIEDATFALEWAAGRALSMDQAIAYAFAD